MKHAARLLYKATVKNMFVPFFSCRSIYPLLTILTLCAIYGLFFSNVKCLKSEQNRFNISPNQPIPSKFLTSTFMSLTGGLGNKLFEILSIIGISRTLKRIPYFHINNEYAVNNFGDRIRKLFPKLEEQFLKVYYNINETELRFHNHGCCIHEDPTILKNRTEEYIRLRGAYFQSYKYFEELRDSAREWLIPPKSIMERAAARIPRKCMGKTGICIHVRRGDFLTDNMHHGSNPSFTYNTTRMLIKKYSRKSEVCSVVFGNDANWTRELFKDLREVLVMNGSTPEEDFALSRQFCDVFLITAPSSTFGFWLGYLAKPGAQVYYKSIVNSTEKALEKMHPEDFFLPDWISL